MAYIDLNIETDPEALKDEAVAYIEDALSGWVAAAGNLETIILEVVAEMASEQATIAAEVPSAVFRKVGQELFGLAPIDGIEAVGSTTWNMTDTAGHTIPAGTAVEIEDQVFETTVETTVAVGVSSATIPVEAVETGEAGNDLSGDVTPVDTIAFVDSVTLVGTTSGGVDAETDEEYLDRLVDELQLLAPRPIVPTDFEVMSRRIAGVERSVAIDGYNPDDDTYDNERMIAIAAIDDDGEAVSSDIKTNIEEYLESRREVNFVVNAIDPTYTTIDVTTSVTLLPDFDAATVLASVEAAVTDFLQPYNFGRTFSGADNVSRPWVNTTRVGYLNVAEIIRSVPGVAFIDTLTVEGGTVDIDLSGDPAPLTRPGTIAATET
jgi:uncharacterized phage protein gp47/JayE